MEIKKHIELLGHRVHDKVTGFKGVVAGVSFDLYGCVQAIVNPGVDEHGKPAEQCWFDVARLTVTSVEPVMDVPNFEFGEAAQGMKGAAEKPLWGKS